VSSRIGAGIGNFQERCCSARPLAGNRGPLSQVESGGVKEASAFKHRPRRRMPKKDLVHKTAESDKMVRKLKFDERSDPRKTKKRKASQPKGRGWEKKTRKRGRSEKL